MNAKITITVPIQKVHLKISEMLHETAISLESCSIVSNNISKNVSQQTDLLEQLEKIDALRKELALLDANLEDCYNVINGLVVYKTKQKETEISSNATNRTKEG